MRTTSIIILFFICCSVSAQNYRDTVWLKDRTKIPCVITALDYENNLLKFKRENSSRIPRGDVKAFKWNNKMYPGSVDLRKVHCGDMPFVTYTEEHDCFYEEVIQVPGKSASEIYAADRLWVAEYWKSATDVSKLDDTEFHTSVVKGIHDLVDWSFFGMGARRMNVSLKFKAKEGRYKLKVEALSYEFAPSKYNNYNPADLSPKYFLDPADYFNAGGNARGKSWSTCQQTNEFFRDVSNSVYENVLKADEDDDW